MARPEASPGVKNRRAQVKAVRKELRLSPDDWAQVARRMDRVGETNFSRFARQQLLTGQVIVSTLDVDERRVISELKRIGNNLNQIAYRANSEHHVTQQMALDVLDQFHELCAFVKNAYEDGGHRGSRESSQHL